MHIGRSYALTEFVRWTRRKSYILLAVSTAQVAAFEQLEWRWIAMPWAVAAMLGTAASFIVGFKNAQTYARTTEAQHIWSSIASSSRYWGLICRDFPPQTAQTMALIRRHLAWLTAVRYQLRASKVWEAAANQYNFEYSKRSYKVAEHETTLAVALTPYLDAELGAVVAQSASPANTLLALQSAAIKELYATEKVPVLQHMEMQKTLKDFIDLHSRAERIKNFPYPRQYAIIHTIFVWSFALLLPLGVVKEFDKLGEGMAWLAVPFSVLIAWMYVSLDQVGESTENPFEGGANDVPITHICHAIECDLRQLLGEAPPAATPQLNQHIIL